MRTLPAQLTNEQLVNFLIGHLEGVAREKRIYAPSLKARSNAMYVARQKLSSCRQESGESCTAFANRVLNLVHAATSSQDVGTQKERVLQEFVARLRCDIRGRTPITTPLAIPTVGLSSTSPKTGSVVATTQQEYSTRSLVTTFRPHPVLVHISNTLVYDGALESGTPAHWRNDLILRLSLPNSRVPFILVYVRGTSYRSHSSPHYNDYEDQCCRDIIRGLLSRDVPSSSIGVITFYKEQQHRLQEYADRLGVALYTVDSVQGREMDVVIILTTRTDVDETSGNFLNDIQRMNVALTRCKYGQFVLGYLNALHTLSNWSQLVAWAARRNTIVDTADLPGIFSLRAQ
ncbi:hypothetical protein V3C99_005226 [Haemonchus contortus]|uniref:AAA_12 domain-containing protein n=1 Tax=Haemonchus contortus TaxID=6289 RepID=A0A7I4XVU3_HAECO